MADGHLNKCKECTKLDVAVHREENIEKVRAYDRIRMKSSAKKQKYRTDWNKSPQGRAAARQSRRNWNSRYPERKEAHTLVASALKSGKLTKLPCFVCGESEVQGHHPDYNAPLDVIWLCAKHHAEVHQQYDDETNFRLWIG